MPKTRDEVFAVELGIRLRDMRQTFGLSQAQLADRLGVSYQQVQKYESGKTKLSVETFCSWSRVCMVSPAVMIEGMSRYVQSD